MFSSHSWLQDLKVFLHPYADPTLADPMAAYMKHKFPFLGIKAPDRKVLFQAFIKEKGLPSVDHLTEVIKGLYSPHLPEREYQMIAVLLCKKRRRQLTTEHKELLWFMITNLSWWDTVDDIASNLVGFVLKNYPEKIVDWNEEMIRSDNLWLRRTALLFQLKYKLDLNEDLLYRNIRSCNHEEDFFIRKAIGWALRQHSKVAPGSVRTFIDATSLSPLSIREGSKYL